MTEDLNKMIEVRIGQIKNLADEQMGSQQWLQAGGLALTVLNDTVGGSHPLFSVIDTALKKNDSSGALAASRGVVALFEQGGLKSPRLAIAHEIQGSLLDIAQAQAQEAEKRE